MVGREVRIERYALHAMPLLWSAQRNLCTSLCCVRSRIVHRQISAPFGEENPTIIGNGQFHRFVQIIDQHRFYEAVFFGHRHGVCLAVIERLVAAHDPVERAQQMLHKQRFAKAVIFMTATGIIGPPTIELVVPGNRVIAAVDAAIVGVFVQIGQHVSGRSRVTGNCTIRRCAPNDRAGER